MVRFKTSYIWTFSKKTRFILFSVVVSLQHLSKVLVVKRGGSVEITPNFSFRIQTFVVHIVLSESSTGWKHKQDAEFKMSSDVTPVIELLKSPSRRVRIKSGFWFILVRTHFHQMWLLFSSTEKDQGHRKTTFTQISEQFVNRVPNPLPCWSVINMIYCKWINYSAVLEFIVSTRFIYNIHNS